MADVQALDQDATTQVRVISPNIQISSIIRQNMI